MWSNMDPQPTSLQRLNRSGYPARNMYTSSGLYPMADWIRTIARLLWSVFEMGGSHCRDNHQFAGVLLVSYCQERTRSGSVIHLLKLKAYLLPGLMILAMQEGSLSRQFFEFTHNYHWRKFHS
ncbi:hypothetical protein Pst134EB_028532 [Puccinia striiformis f. sp. tritici]|nr:hypothetical protein Pst134EB_028532 [Puccinia striiformis f. sp. tritici]